MSLPYKSLPTALLLSCSVLLFGCPGNDAGPCGELESFSAQGCAGALSDVERQGVWHGLVTLSGDGGATGQIVSYAAFHGDDVRVHGQPATETELSEHFFLAGESVSSSQRVRHAYYGCTAPDPQTVVGDYQLCVNGVKRGEGRFELKRLGRPDGEAEASGLERVGEAAVLQGRARDVAVHNGRAYLAAEEGLVTIFDVSDPAAPQPIADLSRPPSSTTEEFWYEVEVFEDVLYVAGFPAGVRAYDLSTGALIPPLTATVPAQATGVGSITVDPVSRRLLANTFAGEVLIFNINVPTSPVLIGRFALGSLQLNQDVYPHASDLSGDRLYAVFGPLGVVVADVSLPSAPAQLAEPFAPPSGSSNSLVLVEDDATVLAYEVVRGWSGHVRILDVSNPNATSLVTEYQTRPHVSASTVTVQGSRAYVAYYQDGVRVLDLTDPRAPVLSAWYDTHDDTVAGAGTEFYEGAISVHPASDGSGLVYVADNRRGLIILRHLP